MSILVSVYSRKTLLDCVAGILRSIGVAPPGSLVGADRNVISAAEYVNEAAELIWYWTDWHWKVRSFELALLDEEGASSAWYPLPNDFHEIYTQPLAPYGALPITYVPYDELTRTLPGFRFPVPDFESEAMFNERQGAEHLYGPPQLYTVYDEWLGLYPIPSLEYCQEVERLMVNYYPVYRRMLDEGDRLPIAPALEPAHTRLSRGLYKQSYEHSDAKIDTDIGMGLLQRATARRSKHAQAEHSLFPGV